MQNGLQCTYSAIILLHVPSWVPKIQIMQNKYIQFFLRLYKMHHISFTKFKTINWLPIKERVHQCMNVLTFKYVNNNFLFYLNEIFEFAMHCRIDPISFGRLKHPFCQTNTGQKTLLYISLSLWNNQPKSIKKE